MSVKRRPKYTNGMNDVRRILDKIGNSSLTDGGKDWALWSLLGALRGPDDENDTLKGQTTSRLRAKIFPNLAESAQGDRKPGELHRMNASATRYQRHFIAHHNLSIQALESLNIIQRVGE